MNTRNGCEAIDVIYNKLNDLNTDYQKRHSKVLALRYDFHYPDDSIQDIEKGNRDISRCMTKIRQNLKRKGLDPAYAWVREQKEDAEHQHYHAQILLNGNKIQSGYNINKVVDRLWASTINDNTPKLVHHCNDDLEGCSYTNGTLYKRSEHIPNIVEGQIGYLSKPQGKGEPNDGYRDFGMSRIRS